MGYLYTPLFYLLLPVVLVRLVIRGFSNPAYWRRWGERFGYVPVPGPVDLWVHAVSVGEVQAAKPLVDALLQRQAVSRVLVTTMTPTGSDQVRKVFGEAVSHCYAPYDYPGAVRRFFGSTAPQVALFMETEIWPNIVRACRTRGVPLIFANVRLSARSYRRYTKVAKLMDTTLRQVDAFAVQTRADAQRLQRLGARSETIHITGSIKFEVKLPGSLAEVSQVLRRQWGQDRRVWIAGSTHEGEDEMVLDAYLELREQHPDLLLVIVPRHPERFPAVLRLARKTDLSVVARSEGPPSPDTEIYVGDTMGDLTLLYAASDIAFVGGSLVPTGGHNILEPCALEVPVIFGPHMFNFLRISEMALEREAGRMVADQAQLANAVDQYLRDPNLRFRAGEAGRLLVDENKGALEKTLGILKYYFPKLDSPAAHIG